MYVEDGFQNQFFTHKKHTQNLYIIMTVGSIKNNAVGTLKKNDIFNNCYTSL